MKVIVKQSGFYAGDWFDTSDHVVEMPDAVAAQYLPPFGDALQLPASEKPVEKPAVKMQNKD